MSISSCANCNYEISLNSKTCPKCGDTFNTWYTSKLWITFWLLIFTPAGIYGLFKRGNKVVGSIILAVVVLIVVASGSKGVQAKPLPEKLESEFISTYDKRLAKEVDGLLLQTMRDKNIGVGLQMRYGILANQVDSVMKKANKSVHSCTKNTFLGAAREAEVSMFVNAYKTGDTKDIVSRVGALKKSLFKCVANYGEYADAEAQKVVNQNAS